MNCPKCNAATSMQQNEDGDMECLCGYIVYNQRDAGEPSESRISVKGVQVRKAKTYSVEKMCDDPASPQQTVIKKPVCSPVKEVELEFALGLLRDDEIKAFTKDFETRATRYGDRPEVAFDAYMETFIERNDLETLQKMLEHWHKYLSTLTTNEYIRGAQLVLSALTEICQEIDKLRPPEV